MFPQFFSTLLIIQFLRPKDAAQHSPFLECGVERSVCPDWANHV